MIDAGLHLLRGFAAEAVEDLKNARIHATPDNKRIRIHALKYAFDRKESGTLRIMYIYNHIRTHTHLDVEGLEHLRKFAADYEIFSMYI